MPIPNLLLFRLVVDVVVRSPHQPDGPRRRARPVLALASFPAPADGPLRHG